jgi:molecular chaperone DnaK
MNEFFGIDFGTTNSAVVGRLRQNATQYDDGAGQPFPSLVAISRATGAVHAIGREAWNHRLELAESCEMLSSAKMYLGTDKVWRIGPEAWTPRRVVTEILKGLRSRVSERGSGAVLDSAVIAIPVGFAPEKRRELRKAARDAGIDVKGFVSEPTAAVFRNFEEVHQWPTVVVFDWGGGTLDISVVSIRGDVVEEIATISNPIGGDVLDRILAEWAHMQILRKRSRNGPPLDGMDARYRDLLLSQCEIAKRTLINEDLVEISVLRYGEFGTVNLVLVEEEFSELMRPKINEAIATLEEGVQNRAHLSFDQIGCIVMVGGSSNLRGLRAAMDERSWTCDIRFPSESEWHVADGAAILSSSFGEYISAQSIGIRLSDNTIYPMIKKGQKASLFGDVTTFGLVEDADNARFVFVECKDGTDGQVTSMEKILGYLSVPAYGFSNEPIRLNIQVDEDLLLHVTARSQCKAKMHERTWTYGEVRFSYQLPAKI